MFVVFIVNPNNSKVVNAPREKMKLHIQFILRRNKLPRRKEGIYLHSCGGVGDILSDGAASPLGPRGLGSHLPAAAGSCLGRVTGRELPRCPACGSSAPLAPFLQGEEALWGSLKAQCWSLKSWRDYPKRHRWDFDPDVLCDVQSSPSPLSLTLVS